MTEASKHTGRVIWRELMTTEGAASEAFYRGLLGWAFEPMPVPGSEKPYMIGKIGDKSVGGIMELPKDVMGGPPCWISYTSVPDVDAACAAAAERGAKVVQGPVTMEGVGRMATLLDADGACFAIMTPTGPDEAPGEPPMHGFCWETLSAKDPALSQAFYEAVCGWKPSTATSGISVMTAPDGAQICDVQKAEGMPPMWLTYVQIESLDVKNGEVEKLGGKVIVPRIDVPKVGSFSVVSDPGGAAVGLFVPGNG